MSLHVVITLSSQILDMALSPLHVYVHVVPVSISSVEQIREAVFEFGFTRSSQRSEVMGVVSARLLIFGET